MSPLLLPVVVPVAAGVLCLACARRFARAAGAVLVLAMLANVAAVTWLFAQGGELDLALLGPSAAPPGALELAFHFRFRLDALATFILLAVAALGLLVALYTASFMRGRPRASLFFALFLFTVAMVNGAVLADHLVTLLFFWEGLLLTLYAMIAVGHPGAYPTAVKAFFINGVTDLCLLAGIGLVFLLAQTLVISEVHLSAQGLGGLAFVLLVIGAAAKAGAMPFHSWIPDAAVDAPLPFMALMPGVIEKLLGIYLLTRVSLFMFTLGQGWAGTFLMVVGAATLLLAVLMALVQKDFKRLLAFHAISQVGYMMLGIGTGTAIGIVGGLFHMVNNAMYKGTLFLSGGAVERQAGTTDLSKLGGLARKMPVTFACFAVAALSISGFPLTNGFYSKELIYDAALERGWGFYTVAALGSFFTAASFLKLGHAAFKGPERASLTEVKEAPLAMLLPMIVIAAGCLLFGLGNAIPIGRFLVPALQGRIEAGVHLSGPVPASWALTGITVLVLAAAVLNHLWGARRAGSALGAVDHIHHAPVARQLYQAAEQRWFDPYVLAVKGLHGFARGAAWVDRAIDFFYDGVSASLANLFAGLIRLAHTGSHALYLVWVLLGTAALAFYLLGGF